VLDRLFPGARVNDRRAPDNYSIALAGTPTTKGAGASRSLKLLVQGGTQLVRSRSGGRVLAALLQHLSADLAAPDPSLTRVDATPVVRDGEALLLPPGVADFVNQVQPRLAKAGIAIVDTPHALLDLHARELVVPEPGLVYDAAVIDELEADVKLGNELPRVRPGRYPLRSWFFARSPEHLGVLTRGVAVTGAVPLLHDLDDDDLIVEVEQMASLFEEVTPYGIWYESANELADQVGAVFNATSAV
jgi:hypothetical protein